MYCTVQHTFFFSVPCAYMHGRIYLVSVPSWGPLQVLEEPSCWVAKPVLAPLCDCHCHCHSCDLGDCHCRPFHFSAKRGLLDPSCVSSLTPVYAGLRHGLGCGGLWIPPRVCSPVLLPFLVQGLPLGSVPASPPHTQAHTCFGSGALPCAPSTFALRGNPKGLWVSCPSDCCRLWGGGLGMEWWGFRGAKEPQTTGAGGPEPPLSFRVDPLSPCACW